LEHNHYREICRFPDSEENICILRNLKDCYTFTRTSQQFLYCTNSPYTAPTVPILHQQSLYCTSSPYTAPTVPILHQQSLYCTNSPYTAPTVPILHHMIPVCILPAYFLKTKEYSRDCDPLKDFATCLFYLELSATFQILTWSIIHCRLSNTTYLIYSQLPSIPGGRFLHAQSLDVHVVVM
jgi:hypothetical protein